MVQHKQLLKHLREQDNKAVINITDILKTLKSTVLMDRLS